MNIWSAAFGGLIAMMPSIIQASSSYVVAVSSARSSDTSFRDLQFADRDADRFVEAMRQVGFVEEKNIVRIKNPSVNDLVQLSKRFQNSPEGMKQNSKLVFYYSGHADDRGLHLANGYINEAQLRSIMSSLPSQTKIGILDSCFGGGFQSKGFAPVPAFEIPKASFDEPSGSVFITASASGEFAYESRRLKGSIFTDSLVSGLYGDADGNNDGLITVDELYQHTYSRLAWKGAAMPMRPSQSPAIISDLRGKGAVVLAYPSKVDATLKLPTMMAGEISLATAKGLQMYSISKEQGSERRVRLPSGDYRITVLDGWRVGRGQVLLASAGEAELQPQQITWTEVESEPSQSKGEETKVSEPQISAAAEKDVVAERHVKVRDEGRLAIDSGLHSGFFGANSTRDGLYAKIGWTRDFTKLSRWSFFYGLNILGISTERYSLNDRYQNTSISTESFGMDTALGVFYQAPWKLIPARLALDIGVGAARHLQTFKGSEHRGITGIAAARLYFILPYRSSDFALRAIISREWIKGSARIPVAQSMGLGVDYKI